MPGSGSGSRCSRRPRSRSARSLRAPDVAEALRAFAVEAHLVVGDPHIGDRATVVGEPNARRQPRVERAPPGRCPREMKWSPVRAGLSLLVASVLAASLAVVQSAPASADSLVWARQFAGSSFNQGFGVAMDSTGVYVAGQYSSNNTWDA